MTRHRVVFSRAASAQAEVIADWWQTNRTAAPELFVRELDSTVRLRQGPVTSLEYKPGVAGFVALEVTQ